MFKSCNLLFVPKYYKLYNVLCYIHLDWSSCFKHVRKALSDLKVNRKSLFATKTWRNPDEIQSYWSYETVSARGVSPLVRPQSYTRTTVSGRFCHKTYEHTSFTRHNDNIYLHDVRVRVGGRVTNRITRPRLFLRDVGVPENRTQSGA